MNYSIIHKRPYEYYLGCVQGFKLFTAGVQIKDIYNKGPYPEGSLARFAYNQGLIVTYLDLKNGRVPKT